MRIVQIALEGVQINLRRLHFDARDFIVHHRQKRRRMNAVRFAGLRNRLFSHSHGKTKTADDLDGFFLMRHQIAYFVRGFVQSVKLLNC